jgi:hypothetical protein
MALTRPNGEPRNILTQRKSQSICNDRIVAITWSVASKEVQISRGYFSGPCVEASLETPKDLMVGMRDYKLQLQNSSNTIYPNKIVCFTYMTVNNKQDRRCTYNVTQARSRIIVAVEKQ